MKNEGRSSEASTTSTMARGEGENGSTMSRRASVLAHRIEQGAASLATFAEGLSDSQWSTVVPGDGRTVGVTVHHVGSMYPIEVQLAHVLASGKAIEGVTWAVVAGINAQHAEEYSSVSKTEALSLLRTNSRAAAAAVRALSDDELDRANTVSLNADAPLTAQFFIEDHALRHSWHHLAKLRAAVGQ
jgi:hypothetical protein